MGLPAHSPWVPPQLPLSPRSGGLACHAPRRARSLLLLTLGLQVSLLQHPCAASLTLAGARYEIRVVPSLSLAQREALGMVTPGATRTHRMVDADGDGYTCYLPALDEASPSDATGGEAADATQDADKPADLQLGALAELLGPKAATPRECLVRREGYWTCVSGGAWAGMEQRRCAFPTPLCACAYEKGMGGG